MSSNSKKYEILREELISYIKDNDLKPNDKLPTVRDIIKNTNLSYATVNRTLIEMENEGLITKHQGKGLFVNRIVPKTVTRQIALIIPHHFSNNKIFIDILSGVRSALEKANVGLLIHVSNIHEKEKEIIADLISKQIDGLIIYLEDHHREDYSHILELKEKKFPFVLIDRYIPELETDYVVINNKDTMYKICSYLKYNKNCEKIIFIPDYINSLRISSSEEKTEGFKNAIRVLYNNDEPTLIQEEELIDKIDGLSAAYKNLGICVNHDAMLLDLFRQLKERNKELPANCHIFGYNNSFETPHFATVEQFNYKVGMKAAEVLIEKIGNPEAEIKQIKINPSLVLPDDKGGFYLED